MPRRPARRPARRPSPRRAARPAAPPALVPSLAIAELTVGPVHGARGKRWAEGALQFQVFDGATAAEVPGELRLREADGSIAGDRGKWYVSFEGFHAEARASYRGHDADACWNHCPTCAATLAAPLFTLVAPRLEALGFPPAHWMEQGWWLFDVMAPPVSALAPTGRSRRAGPECVIVEYAQRLRCAVHGEVVATEQEPFD